MGHLGWLRVMNCILHRIGVDKSGLIGGAEERGWLYFIPLPLDSRNIQEQSRSPTTAPCLVRELEVIHMHAPPCNRLYYSYQTIQSILVVPCDSFCSICRDIPCGTPSLVARMVTRYIWELLASCSMR